MSREKKVLGRACFHGYKPSTATSRNLPHTLRAFSCAHSFRFCRSSLLGPVIATSFLASTLFYHVWGCLCLCLCLLMCVYV